MAKKNYAKLLKRKKEWGNSQMFVAMSTKDGKILKESRTIGKNADDEGLAAMCADLKQIHVIHHFPALHPNNSSDNTGESQ